jgi:hypothetical protein
VRFDETNGAITTPGVAEGDVLAINGLVRQRRDRRLWPRRGCDRI